MRLSTGCTPLDELLGGGLETGVLTLVVGEAGTGKTNLSLQLACQALREGPGKVAYVDTEGVSLERFGQIAGKDAERFLRRILFFAPASLAEQLRMVKSLGKIDPPRLVIVDSLNMYYRLGLSDGAEEPAKHLTNILGELHRLTRHREMPVLATAQVYSAEEGSQAFGGRIMEHIVKTIVRFERVGPGQRRATIIKHRSQPEGKQVAFEITGAGLGPHAATGGASG